MAGQKEDKQDFRANLKVVKKENVIDDIVNKVRFFSICEEGNSIVYNLLAGTASARRFFIITFFISLF